MLSSPPICGRGPRCRSPPRMNLHSVMPSGWPPGHEPILPANPSEADRRNGHELYKNMNKIRREARASRAQRITCSPAFLFSSGASAVLPPAGDASKIHGALMAEARGFVLPPHHAPAFWGLETTVFERGGKTMSPGTAGHDLASPRPSEGSAPSPLAIRDIRCRERRRRQEPPRFRTFPLPQGAPAHLSRGLAPATSLSQALDIRPDCPDETLLPHAVP